MAANCQDYTWGRNCKENDGGVHTCILVEEHDLHRCACGGQRR